MKLSLLLAVYSGVGLAAITNVQVVGNPTATQAVISYTAPSASSCTVQVSQSASLTPLVLDVDPGTFVNANVDLLRTSTVTTGLSRQIVIGSRTAQYATAGSFAGIRHFSRALQAYTPHYGLLTCGADTASFFFMTGNIPTGMTYGDPWLSDPTHPGEQPWPEALGVSAPESFIDPRTGLLLKRISMRGTNYAKWDTNALATAYNKAQITPCDSAGPWTNPCGTIVTGGSGTTTVGNSTGVLVIRPPMLGSSPWNNGYVNNSYGQGLSLDQLRVSLTGLANSSVTGFRVLNVCLSLNGGASCATSTVPMTMGQTSGVQTAGTYDSTVYGTTSWLLDSNPRINGPETSPNYGPLSFGANSAVVATAGSGYTNGDILTASGGAYTTAATFTAVVAGGVLTGVTPIGSPSGSYTGVPANPVTVTGGTGSGARLTVTWNNPTGATAAGNVVTWTGGSNNWSLYWTVGGNGRMRLSTVSTVDACLSPPASNTSAEYTITGFVDGTHITVSPTPPSGNLYWCENNFAVMVWRANTPITDGSTVTLTGANLSVLESYNVGLSDNGAGTACFNSLVQGGYFCQFGALYWINPVTGDVVYYGQVTAPPFAGTNAWKNTTYGGESASIDQTQTNFTMYALSQDPNGAGPLILRAVFAPSSITQPPPQANGSQIGNWTQTGSTSYSATYSNSLTFTNMTPQSLNATLVQQMATYDATFSTSIFAHSNVTGGYNCGAYGMTAGVFFSYCFAKGGDSSGWIFAFSAGDGDPAHAGTPGGPHLVGAINTFNTPNGPVAPGQTALTGRALHAIVEGGDTGWVQINTHIFPPVNTTNTSLPATSSTTCASFGVTGNNNECIQLTINQNSGSYEPYLLSPGSPFTGAPGELRTVKLGDTACVTTSSSSCDWTRFGGKELLTLVAKSGATWTFQRKSYGMEAAVSGTIYLYWNSIQTSVPYLAGSVNQAMTVYWNPLIGCAGSPDPHGDCLMQDNNDTSGGHGEWRDGGEAVAGNVSQWSQPIVPWGTVYQTQVGSLPAILQLSNGDTTPFASPGLNFVNAANPLFAGKYGHPWGFDAGSHPNPAGSAASAYESIRAFDNTPVQGGINEPSFTNTTGQLWSSTVPTSCSGSSCTADPDDPFGYGTVISINRKIMAQADSCGSNPLIDISGPASVISTDASGSYTSCYARTAGECYTGSAPGQIFVNCPGVLTGNCAGSGIHGGIPLGVGNDICVGNINAAGNVALQFGLDHTDYAGASFRPLVSATARLRMVSGFENNRLLPDNSWMIFRAEYLNYNTQMMWMAKMVPYPPTDSVARNTFVPVQVIVKPPSILAVNNVVVQFGYQEYGRNCTTRNDPCLATGSTIPAGNAPFSFASETYGGVACALGCTVTIPAISQKVLYYQVKYRNSSNAVIYTGPTTLVVVP